MSAVDERTTDRGGKWIGLVLAVVLAVAVAVVPTLWGYGVMGHRAWLYEPGQLYIYNGEEEALTVWADGRELGGVEPDAARLFELMGGSTQLAIGEEEHSVEVDGDAYFFNRSEHCVAIGVGVDGLEEGEPSIDEVRLSGAEVELHHLESREVIWPRGYPGAVETGGEQGAYMVDYVDCSLLDDRDFVIEYMEIRLDERMPETTNGAQ